MVVALAVLAGDGWWLVHTRDLARQTPRTVTAEMVSRATAVTSASATFTTQVAGLTTVFGRVSEQLKPQRATLTMTTVDGADRFNVSEVVTDSAVYIRAPGLAESATKPWISVPVSGLTADPALMGLYQTDAIPTVDAALIGTATGVRSTGVQTVDGVRATRYVGIIHPATALRRLSLPVRHALDPELTTASGVMHFVAWIDGHHNLVKLQTTGTMSGLSTVTTVDVTAFNEKVQITVPAPSLVAALTATGLHAATGLG